MPAQRRPLRPPASDDDDSHGHVGVRRAATNRGGGGASPESSDGELAASQARAPQREKSYGDPNAEGARGGGDRSSNDSESSLSAGDEDEPDRAAGMEVRLPSALSPRSCEPRSTAGEAACMSFASLAACLAPLVSGDSPRRSSQEMDIHDQDDRAQPQPQHASSSLFISGSAPLSFSAPASLPSRLPHPPGHLFQSSSPSAATSSAPPLSHTPSGESYHPLAGIPGPGSYARKARMPAQKRQLPSPSSKPRDHVEANGTADASTTGGGGGGLHLVPGGGAANRVTDPQPQRVGDSGSAKRGGGGKHSESESSRSGGGGGKYSESESPQSDGGMDEFILVKLAEIRKEVQCPICLGIIRKTRTVMECLHRFCRDCIDKSMRLGNNECPACRTHCASRRSLRDDPNYDALIATLYPDIDKYEEEEFAFCEEEKTRNKKIQATIEETVRKQSEAMGKKHSTAKATANAFARKYRRNMRTRGRGRSVVRDIVLAVSDNEDREEVNANDASKESSSADNHSPDLKQKRGRKRPAPLPSPDKTIASSDHGSGENDEPVSVKENFTSSPLRGEMLAWGKNGTRSQTRYANVGGLNGRLGKGGRVAKMVEHLRTTDEMDKEFNLYLVLLPLDGQKTPKLERPYLSCQPTVSVRHLVQLIALQLSRQVEELEVYTRMDFCSRGVAMDSSSAGIKARLFHGLQRLREDELLSDLCPSFASGHNDLELLYALKTEE